VTLDCRYDDDVDTDNGGDNEWEGAWTHSNMTFKVERSSSTANSETSSSSSSASNHTATNNLISIAEVRKHNTEDDLWIVLENKVYDLTEFAPTHPGGPGYLTMNAGMDGTDPFADVHVSVDARPEAKEYYIGDLDMSSLNEWVFEMSRPLKTASTKTDAQFVEGQSVDFGLSFWVSIVFSTRFLISLSSDLNSKTQSARPFFFVIMTTTQTGST
jgi:cytochrome b involved in lipid metabolism